MLATVEKPSMKRFLTGKKTIEQKVVVRKMKRWPYLEHYAKDSEGDYVGRGQAAHDAALVYVPAKSSKEDIQRQVSQTAYGKEHYVGGLVGMAGAEAGGFNTNIQ